MPHHLSQLHSFVLFHSTVVKKVATQKRVCEKVTAFSSSSKTTMTHTHALTYFPVHPRFELSELHSTNQAPDNLGFR